MHTQMEFDNDIRIEKRLIDLVAPGKNLYSIMRLSRNDKFSRDFENSRIIKFFIRLLLISIAQIAQSVERLSRKEKVHCSIQCLGMKLFLFLFYFSATLGDNYNHNHSTSRFMYMHSLLYSSYMSKIMEKERRQRWQRYRFTSCQIIWFTQRKSKDKKYILRKC